MKKPPATPRDLSKKTAVTEQRAIDWMPWTFLTAAVLMAFVVYSPAARGPFLFDDLSLPMNDPRIRPDVRAWIGPIRPVLMFSYWLNYSVSETNPGSYHTLNVLLHAAVSSLVFVILRKLLAANWLAALGALIFLLHPVQTEVVAYIAGRSESLAALFYFGAFAVFVTRKDLEIGWSRVAVVVLLFAGALASKEHTVTLPALLLLTDLYFNPAAGAWTGVRRNWRLYAPLALGSAVGAVAAFRVLAGGSSAGFGMKDLPWSTYLFTQFRVVFDYLRLFVAPVGLNIDYEYPWSRSITEHGAVFGMVGIVALVGAAVVLRKRFPVASYGLLVFFLILLPTSSIIPIKDPIAERRLYLPMIGLLLVALDFARRAPVPRNAIAAGLGVVGLLFAAATYSRAAVWGDALRAWEDTVAKSPSKPRAHFQLAYAKYSRGRCAESLPHYQRVYELEGPTERLLVDWALALACANQDDEAIAKVREAVKVEPTAHAWATLGMLYGKTARAPEAFDALQKARSVDPAFDMTYVYLGNLALAAQDGPEALRMYDEALRRNPLNSIARQMAERLRAAQPRQ